MQVAFVEIICQYWKNQCDMTVEQAELEIGDALATLLKRKLVKQEGDKIKIGFLDEQIGSIHEASVQKSNAAKSRWNARAKQNDAGAMHVHAGALRVHDSAMQIDADKIREEKRRQEEITRAFFADQIFLERIGPAHRGKDFRKAFADCYAYHAKNADNWELGDWQKKFITWISKVKADHKATDYKMG